MKRTFKELFEEANISPSYTRVRIYEYLERDEHHPTVDEIYKALIDELPTLSKTTVYNTLKLFIEKGVAKQVALESNESRYELVRHEHAHFLCEKCHQLFDVPAMKLEIDLGKIPGFTVNDQDVQLKGICPNCQE
ncbi:MAG: Fur family transcriptional regulator [Candidatus Izemoplasmataceae bacterium]